MKKKTKRKGKDEKFQHQLQSRYLNPKNVVKYVFFSLCSIQEAQVNPTPVMPVCNHHQFASLIIVSALIKIFVYELGLCNTNFIRGNTHGCIHTENNNRC